MGTKDPGALSEWCSLLPSNDLVARCRHFLYCSEHQSSFSKVIMWLFVGRTWYTFCNYIPPMKRMVITGFVRLPHSLSMNLCVDMFMPPRHDLMPQCRHLQESVHARKFAVGVLLYFIWSRDRLPRSFLWICPTLRDHPKGEWSKAQWRNKLILKPDSQRRSLF